MFTGLVLAGVVIGIGVLLVVLFLQRAREGLDTSPRTLLRAYLYAASFAGIVAVVVGLSSVLNWGVAATLGPDVIYGGTPGPELIRCPPGAAGCLERRPEQVAFEQRQQDEYRRRQLAEELLRGATFSVIGAVFYGAHRAARRRVAAPDEARSGLGRAYLFLGTAIFGLATIVLVPTGLYQLLANAVLPLAPGQYRQGIADSFAPGIVSLVVWLLFLRLVVAETRARDTA